MHMDKIERPGGEEKIDIICVGLREEFLRPLRVILETGGYGCQAHAWADLDISHYKKKYGHHC